jgi:methyltransferase (TIGR00027 family)
MFVRTRFFDRMLTEALERNVAQVAVLGAGLDSRGYRFQDQLRGVKFFEVDFPPTQEHKKQRVKEIFGHLPEQVRYVAMDFTKDDLLTELRKSGYRPEETTLFLWEAVSFYLPESAVKATLHFVRDYAGAGSTIAFDYTLNRNPDVRNPHSRYAQMGEPWLFGFPDSGAADFVRGEGLEVVQDLRAVGRNSPEGQLARSAASNLPPLDPQRLAVMGLCIARTPERIAK